MNDERADRRAKVSAAAQQAVAIRPIPREAMESGDGTAGAIALENYDASLRAERPSSP